MDSDAVAGPFVPVKPFISSLQRLLSLHQGIRRSTSRKHCATTRRSGSTEWPCVAMPLGLAVPSSQCARHASYFTATAERAHRFPWAAKGICRRPSRIPGGSRCIAAPVRHSPCRSHSTIDRDLVEVKMSQADRFGANAPVGKTWHTLATLWLTPVLFARFPRLSARKPIQGRQTS